MIPIGTIGFISRPGNVVSEGIEWFSRWSQLPGFKPVEHWLTCAVARPDQFVCSGLIAVAMNALPEYAGRGVLANGYYAVEPEDLFCDGTLFEPGYTEWNGSYPVDQTAT